MLTAKDGDLDQAEALDTGADDYLMKPFSFPVLVARIRALLRRTGQRRPRTGPSSASSGSIRCHGGSGTMTSEIELTTREFELLEFLVRRAGHVLSKTDIVDGVWSDDFDGDLNIVEVYIARLRRKLAHPDTPDPVITTIRGAGYRLETD